MDSSGFTSLLSRAALTANPLSTSQSDIIAIFQQEQEHALSLLSLSPLLSTLFVSYASRAGPRGSGSSTTSTDSEEWKVLQDTIASLREENEKLRLEARDMVRKLAMAEASQEMLRSHVSSLDESNAIHREDIKSLRAEIMDVQEKYDRVMADSEAERATLRVKVSDLEAQRGRLRDTVVKQQIRVSKLERPTMTDGTLPLRLPNTPSSRRDSDSGLSLPLPDSPTSPFYPLPPSPIPRMNGRVTCMSPSPRSVASLRPHPMARGGLVPGRHKASTADLRSDSTMSGWFADGD